MQIIKLNATDSTNEYLKRLCQECPPKGDVLVWAKKQTHGKGQQGARWFSQEGKNLTFSILKQAVGVAARESFVLNRVVTVALADFLREMQIPQIALKWPNDILSGKKKICGILIENTISKGEIIRSIIGIGLNVNQTDFAYLPKASSLKNITGKDFVLEDLLQGIAQKIQTYCKDFLHSQAIEEKYDQYLWGMGKPVAFQDAEQKRFMAIIKGVSPQGELIVQTENQQKKYLPKQIQMLF